MQTGDEGGLARRGLADMRVLTCLTAALLGIAAISAQPPAAFAEADQSWQTCIGVTAPPDDKVAACSAVIDAKRETGSKLAAAYCFRGHGLTEKRQYDAALADLNESIRLDPFSACALTNAAASTPSSAISIVR